MHVSKGNMSFFFMQWILQCNVICCKFVSGLFREIRRLLSPSSCWNQISHGAQANCVPLGFGWQPMRFESWHCSVTLLTEHWPWIRYWYPITGLRESKQKEQPCIHGSCSNNPATSIKCLHAVSKLMLRTNYNSHGIGTVAICFKNRFIKAQK